MTVASQVSALASAVAAQIKAARDRPLKVLALGTSITFGEGASTTTLRWADRFPAQVAALVPAGSPAVTVVNAGVSGDTSAQMLARLQALLATHRPGYVLIETSINDARIDLSVTSATTVDNLRQMAALCRLYGAVPIIGTAAPIDTGMWINVRGATNYDQTSWVKAKATNALVRTMCAALFIDLVDLETGFGYQPGTPINPADLYDGIHPNDSGHFWWAVAWARVFTRRVTGGLGTAVAAVTSYSADNFNRTDSATTLAGTGAAGWLTPAKGTWGISGNKAYAPTNADDDRVLVNATVGNCVVAITGSNTVAGTPYMVGVFSRADGTAAAGYLATLAVQADGTGLAVLWKKVAGVYTTLRQANLTGLSANTRLQLSTKGTTMRVMVDYYGAIEMTDTAIPSTNTGAGIRWAAPGYTNSRFEDFWVTS